MKGFIFMNNTPPPGQISMPGMALQQPQPQSLKSYVPQTPQPGQISMPGIAPQQFQQGYPPQTPTGYAPQTPLPGQIQQPGPQPTRQTEQEVKFYKSGFFGFSSAAGKFQHDYHRMQSQGWQVRQYRMMGINFFLQRIITVIYER
jgi:hypothetical protein